MAGDTAISLAQPLSSLRTASPYANTTTARENHVAIDDFAPGAVRESVAHIERATATWGWKGSKPIQPTLCLGLRTAFPVKAIDASALSIGECD